MEPLTAALKAIPQDVKNVTIQKHIHKVMKGRVQAPDAQKSKHSQFIDLWCVAFMEQFTVGYVFLAKDAAAVKKLMVVFEVEHLMRIVTAAWAHKETYPCSMALTLPKLLSHINEIREWLNANHGKAKGTKMPAFKQLEMLRAELSKHPCNPKSISYDPDSASLKAEYTDIKRKIAELEASERQRALE